MRGEYGAGGRRGKCEREIWGREEEGKGERGIRGREDKKEGAINEFENKYYYGAWHSLQEIMSEEVSECIRV